MYAHSGVTDHASSRRRRFQSDSGRSVLKALLDGGTSGGRGRFVSAVGVGFESFENCMLGVGEVVASRPEGDVVLSRKTATILWVIRLLNRPEKAGKF